MDNQDYKKYRKYKSKYLALKNQIGGVNPEHVVEYGKFINFHLMFFPSHYKTLYAESEGLLDVLDEKVLCNYLCNDLKGHPDDSIRSETIKRKIFMLQLINGTEFSIVENPNQLARDIVVISPPLTIFSEYFSDNPEFVLDRQIDTDRPRTSITNNIDPNINNTNGTGIPRTGIIVRGQEDTTTRIFYQPTGDNPQFQNTIRNVEDNMKYILTQNFIILMFDYIHDILIKNQNAFYDKVTKIYCPPGSKCDCIQCTNPNMRFIENPAIIFDRIEPDHIVLYTYTEKLRGIDERSGHMLDPLEIRVNIYRKFDIRIVNDKYRIEIANIDIPTAGLEPQ